MANFESKNPIAIAAEFVESRIGHHWDDEKSEEITLEVIEETVHYLQAYVREKKNKRTDEREDW